MYHRTISTPTWRLHEDELHDDGASSLIVRIVIITFFIVLFHKLIIND